MSADAVVTFAQVVPVLLLALLFERPGGVRGRSWATLAIGVVLVISEAYLLGQVAQGEGADSESTTALVIVVPLAMAALLWRAVAHDDETVADRQVARGRKVVAAHLKHIDEIDSFIREGKIVQAVQVFTERTGVTQREAMDAIAARRASQAESS